GGDFLGVLRHSVLELNASDHFWLERGRPGFAIQREDHRILNRHNGLVADVASKEHRKRGDARLRAIATSTSSLLTTSATTTTPARTDGSRDHEKTSSTLSVTVGNIEGKATSPVLNSMNWEYLSVPGSRYTSMRLDWRSTIHISGMP